MRQTIYKYRGVTVASPLLKGYDAVKHKTLDLVTIYFSEELNSASFENNTYVDILHFWRR